MINVEARPMLLHIAEGGTRNTKDSNNKLSLSIGIKTKTASYFAAVVNLCALVNAGRHLSPFFCLYEFWMVGCSADVTRGPYFFLAPTKLVNTLAFPRNNNIKGTSALASRTSSGKKKLLWKLRVHECIVGIILSNIQV